MSSFRTSILWATCLLCLNSLKGLLSIRFLVAWLVIAYTQLRSLLIEGISTETALLKEMNDILLNMNKQHVTILVLLADLSAAFDTVDHNISLTDYCQNLVWMALPLAGFDLICLAVPSESLFGELYLISLTCGMVFLKARVLAHLPSQFMQAHFLMSPKSTSQLSIFMPITLSYTSRLVPRLTLAWLRQLLLSNIAFKTSACSGCLKTSCSWMMRKQNFFWSAPDSNSLKSQLMV